NITSRTSERIELAWRVGGQRPINNQGLDISDRRNPVTLDQAENPSAISCREPIRGKDQTTSRLLSNGADCGLDFRQIMNMRCGNRNRQFLAGCLRRAKKCLCK